MNKKSILLILIISAFLSVMAISVFGKNGEPESLINATGITFYNDNDEEITDETEDSRYKDKLITIDINEDTTHVDYYFSLVVSPDNTTNPGVVAKVLVGQIQSITEVDENKEEFTLEEGTVHPTKYYYLASFDKDELTTTRISFTYNIGERGTHKFEYLRFVFNQQNEDHI